MVFTWNAKCIIPENIHTIPPTSQRVTETRGGGGGWGEGVQKESISEAVGLASQVFFWGVPSKIDQQA